GRRHGGLMLGAVVLLGSALAGFAFSPTIWLSLPLLFVMGFASMSYTTLNQGFLQRRVDDQMRGRGLSLLSMAWFGLEPFGSMQTGTLASVASPQLALAVGGLICIGAAAVVMARWPTLRTLR